MSARPGPPGIAVVVGLGQDASGARWASALGIPAGRLRDGSVVLLLEELYGAWRVASTSGPCYVGKECLRIIVPGPTG